MSASNDATPTRRTFLKHSAVAAGAGLAAGTVRGQQPGDEPAPGDRPKQDASVTVLNPRQRVPVSFIIDDSTCLVNMAHFGIPQFHTAWPDRYPQDWRSLPREIPDDFVRKFRDWCGEHEVKGKYSIVPNPCCVGWLDRELPGWTNRQRLDSLKLVRDTMMDDWDIHPEMITHTWIINTKTGRPHPKKTGYYIENAGWSQDKSADELGEYMAYALRILRNVDLPCEGLTTPGGFAHRNLANLALGTKRSVREVFDVEVPHYFRHLFTGDQSVAPRVEYASDLDTDDPKCVVSIVGCTGDWFGGWDGLSPGSVEKFITKDLQQGRMVEVIERGEPAIMVCHWPGIYFNGKEVGFNIFKEVVRRIHRKYDHLFWMKNSEIARYWAAKELTRIERDGKRITLDAPFATPWYTVRFKAAASQAPTLHAGDDRTALKQVQSARDLRSGTWRKDGDAIVACFDLPKGRSELRVG